jgi:heat shock protein HtpX
MEETQAPAPAAGPRINATDFLAAQRSNRRNTVILVVVMLALGAGVGYGVGWIAIAYAGGLNVQGSDGNAAGLIGSAVLVAIGGVTWLATMFAGDRIVLAANGAREVTVDAEPMLHNVVEEMAIAAGLPKPRVAIIESPAMNAFAAGMRTDKAVIGVTRGLLQSLNRDELQGVIAHEMSHVLNLDMRYMTAVGVMAGLIALVGDVLARGALNTRPSRDRDRRGGNIVVIVIVLVLAILAPLAARLVQFAVSRQREFLADANSVQLTRNPLGLIGALEKLGGQAPVAELGNRATQHLFIVNPLRDFGPKVSALVATHPPIAARIERLRNLGRV